MVNPGPIVTKGFGYNREVANYLVLFLNKKSKLLPEKPVYWERNRVY